MAPPVPRPDPANPVDRLGNPLSSPRFLWGIELRFVLVDLLARHPDRTWRPVELARALGAIGFRVVGDRPEKEIADRLRVEVAKGRVVRRGRARYAAGSMPGATRRRIARVAELRRRQLPGGPAADGGVGLHPPPPVH